MNPFLIKGPAVISFSGGRTSGLMLYRILEAHGGKLPDDVKVVFCNTGKEREETLEFVERCSQRWDVPIVWLEYHRTDDKHSFAIVDFAMASRNGEPFEAVILAKQCVPNVMVRLCTAEMKLRTNTRFLRSLGWTEWDNAIGIRHDEPRRVAKILGRKEIKAETPILPLNDAKVTLADVTEFWGGHSFDLNLRSDEGNCDLCFLKGPKKIRRLISERPSSADWWARMETLIPSEKYGTAKFRNDRAPYAVMKQRAVEQPALFSLEVNDEQDELDIACHCTD